MSAKKAVKVRRASEPERAFTYWVTRDADPDTGVVSDVVRVWLRRPTRHSLGERGSFWMALPREALHCEWTLPWCQWYCKTTPDDDRQCIRVEGASEWQPGQAVQQPEVS